MFIFMVMLRSFSVLHEKDTNMMDKDMNINTDMDMDMDTDRDMKTDTGTDIDTCMSKK